MPRGPGRGLGLLRVPAVGGGGLGVARLGGRVVTGSGRGVRGVGARPLAGFVACADRVAHANGLTRIVRVVLAGGRMSCAGGELGGGVGLGDGRDGVLAQRVLAQRVLAQRVLAQGRLGVNAVLDRRAGCGGVGGVQATPRVRERVFAAHGGRDVGVNRSLV